MKSFSQDLINIFALISFFILNSIISEAAVTIRKTTTVNAVALSNSLFSGNK